MSTNKVSILQQLLKKHYRIILIFTFLAIVLLLTALLISAYCVPSETAWEKAADNLRILGETIIISSSFGDKDFESRLGIFWRNSTAIAEKNNDVLAQKIIGEMRKLFFTCYLGAGFIIGGINLLLEEFKQERKTKDKRLFYRSNLPMNAKISLIRQIMKDELGFELAEGNSTGSVTNIGE